MFGMVGLGLALLFVVTWVGHACVWVSLLSHLYGRPIPKKLLKLWRLFTGLVILGFPLLIASLFDVAFARDGWEPLNGVWGRVVLAYAGLCLIFGGIVFPVITVARLRRKPPASVVAQTTRTLDLWPELGQKLIGDGHLAALSRLPSNGVFCIDFTELTLALPHLPAEWDGLTLVVASDFHFHGTPSRVFFDRVADELLAAPPPDVVCLLGDYLDSDAHHDWIAPVLGRLTATGPKLAILGNHDRNHDPERVRAELAAAGYTVLGAEWQEVTIRGLPCIVVGHEGPWFAPPAARGGTAAEPVPFRLCLSHTPDNFYWGIANRIDLMFCGHVHGGGIRMPLIESIFVPSIYGRRFDHGVFEKGGTVMAVNRGLSGREPLRIRCNPEVLRVKLVRRGTG
jgi:predicted MPP superfamily phosphohydrolase